MSCFAVIKVHQCYDYFEGADCLACFIDESDAIECVQKLKGESSASWRAFREYIDKFVDALVLPEALRECKSTATLGRRRISNSREEWRGR
mgnify:CR=1 FL=1